MQLKAELAPVSWIRESLGYILTGGGHGYCSFPKSIKRCCKRKRYTATQRRTSAIKQNTLRTEQSCFQHKMNPPWTAANESYRIDVRYVSFSSLTFIGITRSFSRMADMLSTCLHIRHLSATQITNVKERVSQENGLQISPGGNIALHTYPPLPPTIRHPSANILDIFFSIHPSFSLKEPTSVPWKRLACYSHAWP